MTGPMLGIWRWAADLGFPRFNLDLPSDLEGLCMLEAND